MKLFYKQGNHHIDTVNPDVNGIISTKGVCFKGIVLQATLQEEFKENSLTELCRGYFLSIGLYS